MTLKDQLTYKHSYGLHFREGLPFSDPKTMEKENIDEESEDECIYEDMPAELKSFWKMTKKSLSEPLNYDLTANDKPDWLDVEKFKKGQKFAIDNFYSISYMITQALIMMFTDQVGRKTFLYSRSFIPAQKAHKQILMIATAVKSWITTDIWNDDNSAARVRMKRANKMHEHYYRQIFSSSKENIEERTALTDVNITDLYLHKFINEDFKRCFPTSRFYSKFKLRNENVTITQGLASYTLFGLAGLVITYPKYYGFHHTTEDDLEDYAHMWKALGYLLGVRDEYNFLNGDLNTIRSRTKSLIEIWMRPAFRELDESWEYQARNFVEGLRRLSPSLRTFDSMILDLMNFLGVDYRSTKKSVSYGDYFRFLWIRFASYLPFFPRLRRILNKMVDFHLNRSEKGFKI